MGKLENRLEPGLKKDVLRAGQGGLLAAVVSALRRRQQQQTKRGPRGMGGPGASGGTRPLSGAGGDRLGYHGGMHSCK